MADADKQAKVEALEKEIKELQEKLKADEGNAGKLKLNFFCQKGK